MNNKIILSEIIMDYLSQLGFYNELNSKVKSFLNDLKLGDNVILKLLKNLEQNGFRFLNNENMFRKLRMLGLDEDVLTNLAKFLNEESTNYKIVNYFLVKNINGKMLIIHKISGSSFRGTINKNQKSIMQRI